MSDLYTNNSPPVSRLRNFPSTKQPFMRMSSELLSKQHHLMYISIPQTASKKNMIYYNWPVAPVSVKGLLSFFCQPACWSQLLDSHREAKPPLARGIQKEERTSVMGVFPSTTIERHQSRNLIGIPLQLECIQNLDMSETYEAHRQDSSGSMSHQTKGKYIQVATGYITYTHIWNRN